MLSASVSEFLGVSAADNGILLFRRVEASAAEAVVDLGLIVAEFAEVELVVHRDRG